MNTSKPYRKKYHFWQKGGFWFCTEPRKTLLPQMSWKIYGLKGKGLTVKEAFYDYLSWVESSDFVAAIY